MMTFIYGSPTDCGGRDNQDCMRKAFEVYKNDTDAIIAEVVSLRSPSEALIRMRDSYLLLVNDTKAHGKFEVVNQYWREANEHLLRYICEHGYCPPQEFVRATLDGRFLGADDLETRWED